MCEKKIVIIQKLTYPGGTTATQANHVPNKWSSRKKERKKVNKYMIIRAPPRFPHKQVTAVSRIYTGLG
jgi:hypothetical protein